MLLLIRSDLNSSLRAPSEHLLWFAAVEYLCRVFSNTNTAQHLLLPTAAQCTAISADTRSTAFYWSAPVKGAAYHSHGSHCGRSAPQLEWRPPSVPRGLMSHTTAPCTVSGFAVGTLACITPLHCLQCCVVRLLRRAKQPRPHCWRVQLAFRDEQKAAAQSRQTRSHCLLAGCRGGAETAREERQGRQRGSGSRRRAWSGRSTRGGMTINMVADKRQCVARQQAKYGGQDRGQLIPHPLPHSLQPATLHPPATPSLPTVTCHS